MLKSTMSLSLLAIVNLLVNFLKLLITFVAPWNFAECSLNSMAFVSWVVWFIQSAIICSRSSSASPSCGIFCPYTIHACILVFTVGSFILVLSMSLGMDSSRSGSVSFFSTSSSGWYNVSALWLTGLYCALFIESITVWSCCLLPGTMAIPHLSISSMFGFSQSQYTCRIVSPCCGVMMAAPSPASVTLIAR